MFYSEEVIEQLNTGFSPSSDDVLYFLKEHGKMSIDDAVFYMKKQDAVKVLERHTYSIYQAADGRWRTYIKPSEEESRKRIIRTHLKDLYEFLYQFYAEQDEHHRIAQMTLRTLYPKWKEYKTLHTNAITTIDRIEVDWKKFYSNFAIANISIVRLDKSILDNWAHNLVRKYQLTKKQYYNMAVIINQALDYAVDKGYISENPYKKVHVDNKLFTPVRKKESSTQVFMEGEDKALKAYAWKQFNEGRHKKQPLAPLAVLFMLQTGLRVGELRALRYEDVNLDGKYITISKMIRNETGEVVEHTKGRFGDREVPLSDEAIRIIETAKKTQSEKGASTDGYVFSMNDEPIGYYAINNAFYMYCDAIGTVRKSTHKARKTVVSALYDGDMNPDGIRRMMGHVDIRTTMNNYCFDRRTDETNRMILNKAL